MVRRKSLIFKESASLMKKHSMFLIYKSAQCEDLGYRKSIRVCWTVQKFTKDQCLVCRLYQQSEGSLFSSGSLLRHTWLVSCGVRRVCLTRDRPSGRGHFPVGLAVPLHTKDGQTWWFHTGSTFELTLTKVVVWIELKISTWFDSTVCHSVGLA